MALEQEVKLAYPDVEAARLAVTTAGGRLVTARRLLEDVFFDTHHGHLRQARQALRVRQDQTASTLTWKGAPQPGRVKTREEIEIGCAPRDDLVALLGALGYAPCFRSQKYREEYALDGILATVDETPFAVFVEIEGTPDAIGHVVARLGRSPDDYELASYLSLWRRWCESRHLPFGDMVFERTLTSG